jgi:DMSO reductase anchor subunit
LYAALLWWKLPGSKAAGALTLLFGVAGVTASASIYLVRSRPAWRSKHTVGEFHLTGALLGPSLAVNMKIGGGAWPRVFIVAAASGLLLNLALKLFWLVSSETFELKATARLLSVQLRSLLLFRCVLLLLGGVVLPLYSASASATAVAFVLALFGEIAGRYLFFVSVVPKNMAASFLSAGKVAT